MSHSLSESPGHPPRGGVASALQACSGLDWWAITFVPPAVAFLIARCVIHVFSRIEPWYVFSLSAWTKYDAIHYLDIARHSYWFKPPDGRTIFGPQGPTGWFPGYPYLIHLLSPSARYDALVAMTISALCEIGVLALIWQMLRPTWTWRGFLCLLTVALAPGFFFLHAISPVSMLLLVALLMQIALLKRRWLAVVILAAFGTFSYATGIMLSVVACVWLLLDSGVTWWRKAGVGAVTVGVCLAVLATVFMIQDAQSGYHGSFFLRQAEFDNRGFCNPLVTLWHYLRQTIIIGRPSMLTQVPLVSAGIFAAAVGAIRYRKTRPAAERLLVVYLLILWLFPMSVGSGVTPWNDGVLPWRPLALVTPVALFMNRLPTWALWMALAAELMFAAISVVRFGQGRLI